MNIIVRLFGPPPPGAADRSTGQALAAFTRSAWACRAPLSVALAVALALFVAGQFREVFLVNAESADATGAGLFAFASLDWFLSLYLPVLSVSFLAFYLRLLMVHQHAANPVGDPPSPALLFTCALPQLAMLWQLGKLARESLTHCRLEPGNGFLEGELVPCSLLVPLLALSAIVLLLFLSSLAIRDGYFSLAGDLIFDLLEWLWQGGRRILSKADHGQLAGLGRDQLIQIAAFLAWGLIAWTKPVLGLALLVAFLLAISRRYQARVIWLAGAVLAVFVVLLTLDPVRWGVNLGALPVMSVFAAMLASIGAAATLAEDRLHFPATLLLIGAPVLFSSCDLNDNHQLRTAMVPVPRIEAPAAMTRQVVTASPFSRAATEPYTELETAFLAWLACRPDREPGRPYYVYLAAAQGGGLYAAYHSARFLGELQDQAPEFAGRLFAASGVSGGAVGVTVFGAMMRDLPPRAEARDGDCRDRPMVPPGDQHLFGNAVDATLRQDFLSAVGGALLFRDFFARFSPVPIPVADRARALETRFEENYAAATGTAVADGAGLRRTIFDHWRPDGDAPLLLLNVTDVSTGQRMIASTPFRDIAAGEVASYRTVTGCAENATECAALRLSGAMLLSARFPVVTPAGTLMLPACEPGVTSPAYCHDPDRPHDNYKARFVDGGYFENSGLDTIADLLAGLDRVARENDIRFTVIAFDFPLPDRPRREYGLGEISSPVAALNNARSARIIPARRRVEALPGDRVLLVPVSLDNRRREFTLGWLLSGQTFDRIDADLFGSEGCDVILSTASEPGDAQRIRANNCAARANILDELRATRPETEYSAR